mmetsp:Transcript_23930/g.70494  ORF Transcript_23930/g.70494 Transcript_23930/m.70494 type:complete len:100 (+) Transcript_23930:3-302(+)
MKPFLQDVPSFIALGATILGMMVEAPAAMPGLLLKMGPVSIAEWSVHMAAMAGYTAADFALAPGLRALLGAGVFGERDAHRVRCALDAWRFGAGLDYEL